MSDPKNDTRERVRALVKQVLAAVPPDASKVAEAAFKVEHVVVNSIADKVRKPFDRDESAKSLITEVDLRGLESGARLRIAANAKFTSLAEDIVKESRKSATKVRSVAIGADHGGFRLKEQIKDVLTDFGLQVRDFGTDSEEAVDYPDLAHAVAKSVAGHQVDIGIIVDGAGIGSAMTANKVPGVRAAACYSPALARNSREHNGANILTLGAGQNTFAEVKEIVEAFISSDIAEERHKKRVGKIDNIDRQYRK